MIGQRAKMPSLISLMRRTPVVYNHVLKLDLKSLDWQLVDNYGDIPGVRMGQCLLYHLPYSQLLNGRQVIRLVYIRVTSY